MQIGIRQTGKQLDAQSSWSQISEINHLQLKISIDELRNVNFVNTTTNSFFLQRNLDT